MNLIIQAVFHVPDEENPQEMLKKIGECLNEVINESDTLGEEVKLYGLELLGAVDESAGKKVFLYNSSMLGEEAFQSITENSDVDRAAHIIRVAVEGVESHRERFGIMDQVIENMGGSPDEERLNVYFVFDSGTPDNFCKWAVPLVLNPNPEAVHKAKTDGVTFCQWISRDDRESLLKDVEDQVRRSKENESV